MFGWPRGGGRARASIATLFEDDRLGALWIASEGVPDEIGDSIAEVSDSSPNDVDAVQATGGFQPKFGQEPHGGVVNELNYSYDTRTTAEAGETRPWVATGVTSTIVEVTPPRSDMVVLKLAETATTGYHHVVQIQSVGQSRVFDVYAKAGERHLFNVAHDTPDYEGGSRTRFNLLTGTVDTGAGSIEAAGGGWYRCRHAGTVSPRGMALVLNKSDPTSTNYAGIAGHGVYIAAAQQSVSAAPWQRRVNALNVTELGKSPIKYINFDLSDDVLAATFADLGSDVVIATASEDGVEISIDQAVDGSYSLPAKSRLIAHAVLKGELTPSQWDILLNDFCRRSGHYCGTVSFLA